jgi:hypothetical protein
MQGKERDRFEVAPVLTILAAGALSAMLQWTNGAYHARAIVVVAASWLVVLVVVLGRPRMTIPWPETQGLLGALGLVVAVQLGLMMTVPPTIEMVVRDPTQLILFHFMLVIVAVLAGIGIAAPSPLRAHVYAARWTSGLVQRGWFPAILLLHFLMGRLVIGFVPTPHIDVWSIEMDSVRALLQGINPYSITFPDPYGGGSSFFPPGVSVNGRLLFGFVYPPLCLLLCIPGYILGGDTRWSSLVMMELAALLIAYARPGKISKLAALAFLFMPRTFLVMDRAWTDSFVVFFTAAVCFAALRKPRISFLFIGGYVCLKQHMFIGIPALFMLIPRPIPWRGTFILTLKSGAVAAAITLPFVLWGPKDFARSVLDIREVFRTDSLSLIAHLHNTGMATLSKWTGIAAIIPVIVLGWWRVPRTPGGFALLAGATHFTLYIFSTHAFCNEYYNVVGALCCAVAAWGSYDARALVQAPMPKRAQQHSTISAMDERKGVGSPGEPTSKGTAFVG